MSRVSSERVSPCSCAAISSPCREKVGIFTDSESGNLTRLELIAVFSLIVVTLLKSSISVIFINVFMVNSSLPLTGIRTIFQTKRGA